MHACKKETDNVIQETRVFLPGAQAILGFQLASFFQISFEKLLHLDTS